MRGAVIAGLLVGLWGGVAFAGPAELDDCFAEASERYGVSVPLLKAVAEVESGFRPEAVNRANGNGTYDVGVMQINSSWFPTLEAEYGITEDDLMDACTNIQVGAWVLANNFVTFGWSWEAIGAYNAGTGTSEARHNLRRAYAERVYAALERYR